VRLPLLQLLYEREVILYTPLTLESPGAPPSPPGRPRVSSYQSLWCPEKKAPLREAKIQDALSAYSFFSFPNVVRKSRYDASGSIICSLVVYVLGIRWK
jgi:hypothetical protein